MITIHVDVDREQQSVAYRLEAGEPDHEYDGRKCHRVENCPSMGRCIELLSQLDYELVGAEAVESSYGSDKYIVEYWARRERSDG